MKMSKLLGIILLLICFCVACGNNAKVNPISFNESITIDGYAEVKLEYVFFSDVLYSPNRNSFYTYFENSNSSMEYVDFIFDFKNISKSGINVNDSMNVTIESGGNSYDPYGTFLESSYGQNLDSYVDISPMSEVKVHCTALLPAELNDFVAKFNINEKIYTLEIDKENIPMEIPEIKVGDQLESEGLAKLSISEITYKDEILPDNTSGAYSYYEPENKNLTYLTVTIEAQNTGKSVIGIEKIFSGVVIYNDLYEYGSTVLGNDGDNYITNYIDLDPLEKKKLYLAFEVPNEVKGQKAKIKLYFGEKYYYINIPE